MCVQQVDDTGAQCVLIFQYVPDVQAEPIAKDRQPVEEDRLHVRVDLDGDYRCARLQQPLAERPGPGPDFQNQFALCHSRRVHDPAHVVAIVQKVLPKPLLGVQAVPGQEVLDVGKGLRHGRTAYRRPGSRYA